MTYDVANGKNKFTNVNFIQMSREDPSKICLMLLFLFKINAVFSSRPLKILCSNFPKIYLFIWKLLFSSRTICLCITKQIKIFLWLLACQDFLFCFSFFLFAVKKSFNFFYLTTSNSSKFQSLDKKQKTNTFLLRCLFTFLIF